MDIGEFKSTLAAFADENADIDIRRGRAVLQIRDEVIDVGMEYASDDSGKLLVLENGQRYPARLWLTTRIAKLPQLADRIIGYVSGLSSPTSPFVRPSGMLTPDLSEKALPGGEDEALPVQDAVARLLSSVSRPIPGATSVMYLTSDAGEGKTTIINRVALLQAQRYKAKATASLVVPIPLSGRAFLTFDDAVIAALVNKLRFNYLYFDAFLSLVKLGVVVPAFDGYEEMLVEGSKGEAVSALGGLVQALGSAGTVVIAARKAFFDYLSFRSQARLLDAIGNHFASFSRLALQRWSKAQFLDYGAQRHAAEPLAIYETVCARLGPDHPLLTRAVLVRRLFDVAATAQDRETLGQLLGANPHDYFFTFVDAIVQREASEKWLSRISGDLMEPLLTVQEHHDLLSQIALEMWQSSSNALKLDVLDVLVEIFCEARKKSGLTTRQVKERIKQHSLLSSGNSRVPALGFDHEDFQDFYLGEGLGRLLATCNAAELQSVLSVGVLSQITIEQCAQHLLRVGADVTQVLEAVKAINSREVGFSFSKENCGLLVMRLAELVQTTGTPQRFVAMYFSADELAEKNIQNATFEDCQFQPTSVRNSNFVEVFFKRCEFERLDIDVSLSSLQGVKMEECRVSSVLVYPQEEHVFDPNRIDDLLRKAGAQVAASNASGPTSETVDDERMRVLNRFLRMFLRTTHVNEDVVRMRLGSAQAPKFVDDVLPNLLGTGLLAEVTWEGRGVQRRYRLTVPMSEISKALESSGGSFDRFIAAFGR